MKWIRSLYDWMGSKVHLPHSTWWLALFFFAEACIFPIPVDPLLILFCIKNRYSSFWYAFVATSASVLGGLCGYLIGFGLWGVVGPWFLRWVVSEQSFIKITQYYELYEHWAVLIAGFTPIPYKAVTLSAGFCSLSLAPFIFYSIIARGARFFLEAGAIRIWGEHVSGFIDRHFDALIVVFCFIIFASFYLLAKAA